MSSPSEDFVLGFDLGAKGAIALARRGHDDEIVTRKLHLPPPAKLEESDRAADWLARVTSFIDKLQPIAIAYEQAHFVGSVGASQTWIKRQEGILLALCGTRDIMCIGVPTPTIRAHAKRHGAPTWEKGGVKDAMMEGASNRGWDCQTHDEADAAWVADWLRHQNFQGE